MSICQLPAGQIVCRPHYVTVESTNAGTTTLLDTAGGDDTIDVNGAGDTVCTLFSLGLAVGASFLQAARIANYAAGLVVMKSGAATVTREELLETME